MSYPVETPLTEYAVDSYVARFPYNCPECGLPSRKAGVCNSCMIDVSAADADLYLDIDYEDIEEARRYAAPYLDEDEEEEEEEEGRISVAPVVLPMSRRGGQLCTA